MKEAGRENGLWPISLLYWSALSGIAESLVLLYWSSSNACNAYLFWVGGDSLVLLYWSSSNACNAHLFRLIRMPKYLGQKAFIFPQEMAALFDGTSAIVDGKWAPTMDGVLEDILTDMNSSFCSLNSYDDTPSSNQTNSQSTIREDTTTSDIGADVKMANIGRKRPRPSTKRE